MATIDNILLKEQIKILYKNLLISIPANFLCACAVFIGLDANKIIRVWFSTVIIISLLRLGNYYFYHKNPKKIKLHLILFICGTALSAALWGIMDSFLMPQNDLLTQMIIIIVVAGVTAGGVQTLNANIIASIVYVTLIICPLCIWLFLQDAAAYFVLGIAMTAYLIFMIITSMRGCKLLVKTLNLQYENIALVKNLSLTHAKLLSSFNLLERQEQEITLINKMNSMLQTCQDSKEAYSIIIFTAKELFANYSGGLAILNVLSNNLEMIDQWGKNKILKSTFNVSDCWALREGHSYFVNDTTKYSCYHFYSRPDAYICYPLIIQNETSGLLVIYTSSVDNILDNYQLQLATGFCEVIQLSLANIKLRESLYQQATHDPLTGLFNRRYLDEILARELQRIIREKKPLCVAMLDLDYFKRFNDENGHEAGDEVLKFVGALLNENFRSSDIASRFGGEEFLVVLADTDMAAAVKRMQYICETVKKGNIQFNGQFLPKITISIGIAEAPVQGASVKDIIHAADMALYAAKQSGRDRVNCFSNDKQ